MVREQRAHVPAELPSASLSEEVRNEAGGKHRPKVQKESTV